MAAMGGDPARWTRLRSELCADAVDVVVIESDADLLESLRREPVLCVVLYRPGDQLRSFGLVRALHRLRPDLPLILVTDRVDIASAVEIVRHGARELLESPTDHILAREVRAALGVTVPAQDPRIAPLRAMSPPWAGRLPLSATASRRLGFEGDPPREGAAGAELDPSGWLTISDAATARTLAHAISLQWPNRRPAPPTAGELFAMSLVCSAMDQLVRRRLATAPPGALHALLRNLEIEFDPVRVRHSLALFAQLFPPLDVRLGRSTLQEWMAEGEAGQPHAESLLVQILLIRAANLNRAAGPVRQLFDDSELSAARPEAGVPSYTHLARGVGELLSTVPGPPDGEGPPPDPLRLDRAAGPSLRGQLDGWLEALGPTAELGRGMRIAQGILAEECRLPATGLPGPPPPSHGYHDLEDGVERLAEERPWMPGLVLVAKNLRVWLAQLSTAERRPVRRLDDIPEGALRDLARDGVTGLWLVGLWEPSVASRRIKVATGDPNVGASAYAVRRYRVASDLGGMEALETLRKRAWRHGLRLAADVVPNHTAIDSDWVLEHPDWFLSVPESPFPGYRFTGADLSPDPRVGLYLEDGYRDRSDAAVVFRRVDRATGEVRYVYHGNDGTGLPWNDTAQLDYLNPDARRAVLEAIVDVALTFPILRIDSAMSITRRHVHRLWHPEPGTGGAIPSRAEHGLGRVEFHERMPREFWAEVTEAVADAAPDTLLLAEAFWLMERYFVRSLGMHRVYNSSFLHNLSVGDPAAVRRRLADLLGDDPRITGRLANYLTNPDESPAAATFGASGRYLAAATLLATLPGLPILGHGQIEGFEEGYGMEQERPRRDESPHADRMAIHRARIAPLLARRREFASGRDFRLWVFRTDDGRSAHEVLAYTHGTGDDAKLVVVHYRDATVRGRIVDGPEPAPPGDAEGRRLAETLAPAGRVDPGQVLVWSEERPSSDGRAVTTRENRLAGWRLAAQGLPMELGPWETRVLGSFHAAS